MHSESVLEWLKTHPEFWQTHPEAVALLPASILKQASKSLSINDKQLEKQRHKIRQLEVQIKALVEGAESNAERMRHLLSLAGDLFKARNIEKIIQITQEKLCRDFHLEAIAFALNTSHTSVLNLGRLCENFIDINDVWRLGQAQCLAFIPELAKACFDLTPPARSGAIIPLRAPGQSQAIGLLLLGSSDPERFTPDMGVQFLHFLACIVAAALNEFL